jgi:hypothetical protein
MRMRRHHRDAMGLARQVEVVDIAAAADEKAPVFDAPDRLTDAESQVERFSARQG